jgi:isopenicillin N synthase-like dioxygenase
LRAEHEHASRAAILEAQAYGAVFAVSEDRKPTAAVEIERGYRKESEELRKGAAFFQKTFGSASSSSEALSSVTDSSGAVRVKSATSKYTKGLQYLQAALDTRDGPRVEVAEEENLETFAQSAEIPSDAAEESSAVETPLEESRVEVDVLAGDSQEQGRGGR